ncbi:hypothetical protein Btru_039114 [Bulinus truncatus]|nr:hypothetical protein Btru_039114 [Bulinus truncatus]
MKTRHSTNDVWSVILRDSNNKVVPNSSKNCSFKIYAKANNIKCEYYARENYNITCVADRIYPKAACLWETDLNETKNFNIDVKYNHVTIEENEVQYFKSTCSIVIPLSNNKTTVYNVSVNMYPNITGDITDAELGTMKIIALLTRGTNPDGK